VSREFSRGQKSRLADLTPELRLRVGLAVEAPGNPGFDISCFGLDAQGKLSDDRYFVFYNQPATPEGSIRLAGARDGDGESFEVDLGAVPAAVDRLVFTVTTDSPTGLRSVSRGHLRVVAAAGEVLRFPISGADFRDERAVMVGEIYRRDGWRFAAVGQGFNGGLAALLQHFGGEVADEPAAAPPPPPPPPAAPAAPPVSLSKITLGKAEAISLRKPGKITAKLEWAGQGDLDLYCFYVTADGREDKVYYRKLGAEDREPYIRLHGDSRTPGTETITITRPDALRYALIAAYSAVGNGVGSFASYQPRAVVTDDLSQHVVVPLLDRNDYSYWVAITLIDFTVPGGYEIRHVEQYSGMTKMLGMFSVGEERSPLLYRDGSFRMDVGPVEFK
jgi:stress response protein SCP2